MSEVETDLGRKSILQIKSSQDKDFGKFLCNVTNSYGSTTGIIELEEKGMNVCLACTSAYLQIHVHHIRIHPCM